MKIFIVNGEHCNEKCEVYIDKLERVGSPSFDFLKSTSTQKCAKKYLIYQNIILHDPDKFMNFYKICPKDEIWFGKIENYLKYDDVIIELFIASCFGEFMYLIMKKNDPVLKIKSIIDGIIPNIVNIWDVNGREMGNDQIINDIDVSRGYYKLIIGDKFDGGTTHIFGQCCKFHDEYLINFHLQYYFWHYLMILPSLISDDNYESEPTKWIQCINKTRQIISSNDDIHPILDNNLPVSFVNSGILFFMHMFNVISNVFDGVFSQFAVLHSMIIFLKFWRCHTNDGDRSVRKFLFDALDYSVKWLMDSSNDKRYLRRLFCDHFLFRSCSDSEIDKMGLEFTGSSAFFTMKNNENCNMINVKFPSITGKITILYVKKIISRYTGTSVQQIYCIKKGTDIKPNDKNKFIASKCIFEFASSMDDIEILRSLGCGAFGEVHLCQHKISENQFVLKTPLGGKDNLYRDISIQYIFRQSNMLLSYSGLLIVDGRIGLAMKYMPGGSLYSHLEKENQFSEKKIAKWSHQILVQIKELHINGIIHRDIKSDNIVLDEDNNAKLIDFGIAKCTWGVSDDKLMKNLKAYKPGTMYYMAPEIINCEEYTNKIDIWSFGATVIEMVTRKRPYDHMGSIQATIQIAKTRKIEYEPPEPLSNELIYFIDSCLNPNINARPSAETLIESKFILNYLKEINK